MSCKINNNMYSNLTLKDQTLELKLKEILDSDFINVCIQNDKVVGGDNKIKNLFSDLTGKINEFEIIFIENDNSTELLIDVEKTNKDNVDLGKKDARQIFSELIAFDNPNIEFHLLKTQESDPLLGESEFNVSLMDQATKDEWNKIFEDAVQASPRNLLNSLTVEEKEKIACEEWLEGYGPLMGNCFGLAIEYLLNNEIHGMLQEMAPNDDSHYWSKALIPCVFEVAKKFGCNPQDLKKEAHYDEVYERMLILAKEKGNLNAKIPVAHKPLSSLGGVIASHKGHCLIAIEEQNSDIFEIHMIYINTETRTIADSGTVIKVPDMYHFGGYVHYYIDKSYDLNEDKYTLFSVKKDPNADSVRHPSFFDRLTLNVELFTLSALGMLEPPKETSTRNDESSEWLATEIPPLL